MVRRMKTPEEMNDDVDSIAAYLALGLIIILVLILALLGLEVVIGFLATISIGG